MTALAPPGTCAASDLAVVEALTELLDAAALVEAAQSIGVAEPAIRRPIIDGARAALSRLRSQVDGQYIPDTEIRRANGFGDEFGRAQDVGDGWMPIETAPRDRRIMMFWPYADDGRHYMCVLRYDPPDYRRGPCVQGHCLTRSPPTHWRPLPAPPRAQTEGGEDE